MKSAEVLKEQDNILYSKKNEFLFSDDRLCETITQSSQEI